MISIATTEETPKYWTLTGGDTNTQVGLRPKLIFFFFI